MKLIILLAILIIHQDLSGESKVIELGAVNLRRTYIIKNEKDEIIGKKISLYEEKNAVGYPYYKSEIYILDDGKKYFELFRFEKDYKKVDAAYKTVRHKIALKFIKDTGFESEEIIKVKINEKEYKFSLFHDITYVYLIDDFGKKLYDEEAFKFIISKDEGIKEFFEIMVYEAKQKMANYRYIFFIKKVAKKLGLDKKRYKIELDVFPCTEVEKELGYDCEKFLQYTLKKKIKITWQIP